MIEKILIVLLIVFAGWTQHQNLTLAGRVLVLEKDIVYVEGLTLSVADEIL